MTIFVCVKHVPDTAARIDVKARCRIDENITFIMNPYDENALEEAVRLKKVTPEATVIAVTVGGAAAQETLRAALAMGADEAVLLETRSPLDSIQTAGALAEAIRRRGPADIVFTGKAAIDSEGFQTMFRLAAHLGLPAASNVVSFGLDQERAVVTCEMEAGDREVLEMPLPCVIGAAKSLNQPSYPTLPAILKARKKEIHTTVLEALDLPAAAGHVACLDMTPVVDARTPVELKGTFEEIAMEIIHLLRREAKVLP